MMKDYVATLGKLSLAGVPDRWASRLGTEDSARQLGDELTQLVYSATDQQQRLKFKAMADAAYSVMTYRRQRQHVAAAAADFEADRAATIERITTCRQSVDALKSDISEAERAFMAAQAKVTTLQSEIAADAAKFSKAVDKAQSAFDQAMSSADDAVQKKTAQALHEAKASSQAADIARGGMTLRLAALEQQLALTEAERRRLAPLLAPAEQALREALWAAELIELDEASTCMALAYLKAEQARSELQPVKLATGFGSMGLWFSASRRALGSMNAYGVKAEPNAPVYLDCSNIEELASKMKAPDVSAFVAAKEGA